MFYYIKLEKSFSATPNIDFQIIPIIMHMRDKNTRDVKADYLRIHIEWVNGAWDPLKEVEF